MSGITNVGVIGAGTMGNGIAQVCAVAGIDVAMVDIARRGRAARRRAIGGSLERLVKKEKLTADARRRRSRGSRARPTTPRSRRRPRDRGGHREPRAQAEDPAATIDARAKPEAMLAIQHLVDLDHAARRA